MDTPTNDPVLARPIAGELDSLAPEIYSELRRLAAYYLRRERPDHTLRPTELVHEAYIRMLEQHSVQRSDKAAFIGLASMMMRRVLVNYARDRRRKKRGGGFEKISVDDERAGPIPGPRKEIDVVALEEALCELEKRDERQAKIIELHFFGGLTFEEIASLFDISVSTVMRQWRFARSWLYIRLKEA